MHGISRVNKTPATAAAKLPFRDCHPPPGRFYIPPTITQRHHSPPTALNLAFYFLSTPLRPYSIPLFQTLWAAQKTFAR